MYQDPSRQTPNANSHPEPNGHRPKHKRKGKKVQGKRCAYLCFIVVCTAVALFSLIQLIRIGIQTKAVQQEHQEHQAIIKTAESSLPTSTPLTTDPVSTATQMVRATALPAVVPKTTAVPFGYKPTMLEKYNQLYQENSDLIGWLKVNSLYRIDFPVVQGNNSFYMDHDFHQRENVNGTAFLDETCNVWPQDDNLIIYAHNMKSGEMFGELNQLQSLEKMKENPFVEFGTLYEDGTYIPLAVFVCSVVQADDYFQFYVRNFKSEVVFDKYIDRARELSNVQLKTDAQYGDQLLTLVTCYDRDNTQRLVVLLRKLRANETKESILTAYFN